ncbi:MAG: class I SAM-dependent methyltransferase [Gammaproteobacteria bacterium]|jgi:cyclopropane-fatty-acyl-phospholipid synthase|nr:class I SAM-dependent methyltransferase [Gammaproteobacteria bacterium]
MSEYSVKNIAKLPLFLGETNGGLARSFMLKVLAKLQVGSLVLKEPGETLTFGTHDDPNAPHAEVHVHDNDLYRRILTGGSIAAGETFIEGLWSSPDLTAVTRAFSANMAMLEALSDRQHFLASAALKVSHWARRNTTARSRENISAHYDLGNDFFSLFLDPNMMYSSAVFPTPESDLATAATYKLKLICEDLELSANDHLVEIGTGWGGMAIYAAENYGCRVTTTTISREQYDYAREAVARRGLQDRITVLFDDYRDLSGRFDKLVSIEMIEAVGHQFYDTYFSTLSRLLKPHGKAAIQAITMTEQRYEQARDSVDFIKRYIFPGGCLPSLTVISDALSRVTDLQMSNLRDITRDYADTLNVWHEGFLEKLDEVKEMGFDDRFIRMWRYYLSYCEGGFRERIIGTYQITMTKPGYRPA